jgi:pyridoxamine 5'-phosphate oxidase
MALLASHMSPRKPESKFESWQQRPLEKVVTNQFLADRLPDDLPSDPMHWADAWIKEAHASELRRNPGSMTLVTLSIEGNPSARIVLCKDFVPDPGYLVFYTNYNSRKSREIAANPKVAALFHWDGPGRQIRIEGNAIQSPAEESDAYFATRDLGARLGAWGSDQSAELASRETLLEQIRSRAEELGIDQSDDLLSLPAEGAPNIQRPPHWGGFRIWANAIELWKDGADRIHDRALWTRSLVRSSENEFSVTPWVGTRLQP